MENKKAKNEAIKILIRRHKEEFKEIYKRVLKEVEKYGGFLK